MSRTKADPRQDLNAEAEHTLALGQKVTVEHFGRVTAGWFVIGRQWHPTNGLACYWVLAPDLTRWSYVGKWYNPANHSRIVAW